jgi:DNA-directed RNA polymerase subunit D
MEMKFKSHKGYAEVDLKDTSPSFANALRRIMLTEIALSAIDEVRITENNSALQDEILTHRIGLIPVKGDGEFRLKVEGPLPVVSANLQPIKGDAQIDNMDIPIVELLENQMIDLTCSTRTGTGKEHAKWQAAVVGYQYKNPNSIKMTIESCSTLPEDELLKRSLAILKNKAQEFKEAVSKYKSL